MSLNDTPAAERVHIAFFGRRNAGKSALINALTGQKVSIVSETKGTTTDPVRKTMELLPLGPVVIIDTPGTDDVGELGEMRVKRTYDILDKTDIAVVVVSSEEDMTSFEEDIIKRIKEKGIPYIIAWNKADIALHEVSGGNEIAVSAKCGIGIKELKELIAAQMNNNAGERRLISDLVSPGDIVVLAVPIDEAAPKGRLILPQQQTIRDLLDFHASAVCVQPEELGAMLEILGKKAAMVVCDSQAFAEVEKIVPEEMPLTSFSVLMARYKGDLRQNTTGAMALDKLSDGDTVLISEACTHHRQCNDIGSVKLPKLIEKYTGKSLSFEWTSGAEFPEELDKYKLVIHCGGCMINSREMKARLKRAENAGVPMTNYGVAIAKMTGILDRSIKVFDGKY